MLVDPKSEKLRVVAARLLMVENRLAIHRFQRALDEFYETLQGGALSRLESLEEFGRKRRDVRKPSATRRQNLRKKCKWVSPPPDYFPRSAPGLRSPSAKTTRMSVVATSDPGFRRPGRPRAPGAAIRTPVIMVPFRLRRGGIAANPWQSAATTALSGTSA